MGFIKTMVKEMNKGKIALIIVDMQNDFCHEDGYFHKLAREMPKFRSLLEVRPPVEVIGRLADGFRKAGKPVICLKMELRKDYADCAIPYWKWPKSKERGFCVEGTWGSEIIADLSPEGVDIVVPKKGYGGFFNTHLETVLRNLGIETCAVTGVGTAGCVDTTVREGVARGFKMIVVSDATGGCDRASHDQTLLILGGAFGEVKTSSEVLLNLDDH